MNGQQGAWRIRNVLRSLRWGSTGDPVFGPGSVKVTPGFQIKSLMDNRILPAAMIRPGASIRDPGSGGQGNLYRHGFGVTIVCALPGDEYGEAMYAGGYRAGGATSGDSRGLGEIEAVVQEALEQLGPKDGWPVQHVSSDQPEGQFFEETGYVGARQLRFDAYCDARACLLPPHSFTYTEAGGTVSLAWTAPDDTTDLVKYVLRRVSGALPVARPTEGTAVALALPLSTSKDDAPGAGTWTYSLFAMYAEPGGSVGLYYTDFLDVTVTV